MTLATSTPRRWLIRVAASLLVAGGLMALEAALKRHYYGRRYSYYQAAAVYAEDQHTLLLYLPDRRLFWTLRPGIDLDVQEEIEGYGPPDGAPVARLHAWRIHVGAAGLRGGDFPWRKPASELRVGCFGDSRTFGEGLAEGDTYPARLERRLAGRLPGRVARVLNFGADGWSIFQGLRHLERDGARANLDVATFAFGINDTDVDWGMSDAEMARRSDSPLVSVRRALYRSMIFYWSSRSFLQAKGALFGKTPIRPEPPRGEPRPRLSREEYADTVRAFVLACRSRGIRPILLDLPVNAYYDWSAWTRSAAVAASDVAACRAQALARARRGEVPSAQGLLRACARASVFAEYSHAARGVAEALGVEVVDVTGRFDREQEAGGRPFVDDMHPSASGAEIVAAILADAVAAPAPGGAIRPLTTPPAPPGSPTTAGRGSRSPSP